MELSRQKCRRHAFREAVARCMECNGFFCRECVTEHEDRLLCSDCLLKLAGKSKKKFTILFRSFQLSWGLVCLFFLWFFFYEIGKFLLSLPADFHDGTFWTRMSGVE